MIIFARATGGKILLEATPDEIANILGFDGIGQVQGTKLDLGDDIPVSDIYAKSKAVRGGKNSIDKAALDLQKVVDNLEKIDI